MSGICEMELDSRYNIRVNRSWKEPHMRTAILAYSMIETIKSRKFYSGCNLFGHESHESTS